MIEIIPPTLSWIEPTRYIRWRTRSLAKEEIMTHCWLLASTLLVDKTTSHALSKKFALSPTEPRRKKLAEQKNT
ncbi:hypothetical protein DITRI_Ditri10aG0067700 [Diplodiscus trichospermus]